MRRELRQKVCLNTNLVKEGLVYNNKFIPSLAHGSQLCARAKRCTFDCIASYSGGDARPPRCNAAQELWPRTTAQTPSQGGLTRAAETMLKLCVVTISGKDP